MKRITQKHAITLDVVIKNIFYFTLIFGIFFSLISIISTHGRTASGLFFYDINDTFMDLFNPIKFSFSGNPYEYVNSGAIYPAINYLLYLFLSKFINQDVLMNKTAYELRFTQQGLMLFAVLAIILILVMTYLLYKLIKGTEFKKIITIFCFLFSAPVIFLLERSNILLFVFILLLIYIIGIDSKNIFIKEIALLSLGLAAAIKIYPAIFGLILIYNKKYKEALRCAVYGIVFFCLPFFYFEGIPSIMAFFKNLHSGIEVTSFGMTGVGYRVDFDTIFSTLSILTTGSHVLGLKISSIICYPVCVLLALCSFLFKENWKQVLCIVLIMVTLPSFSYEYSMVFYIIPILLFLNDFHTKKRDLIYVILLSSTLILIASDIHLLNWIASAYPVTLTILIQNIAQFFIIIALIIDACSELCIKIWSTRSGVLKS